MARQLRTALALAALLPVVIASGCGSDSSSSDAPTTTAATPASTAVAPAGATTVAVSADPSGALAFVEKSLTAPAGDVTFDFTNDSPVPHNVTVEAAGTENELGASKTITSGADSVTITLAAGDYTYYCSVPGHEAAGMKGTLTVE